MCNLLRVSDVTVSRDIHNGKFILKNAIDSLNASIESMESPTYTVPEISRRFLIKRQISAIGNAFLSRKTTLKRHIEEVKRQFSSISEIGGLRRLQRKQQSAR